MIRIINMISIYEALLTILLDLSQKTHDSVKKNSINIPESNKMIAHSQDSF